MRFKNYLILLLLLSSFCFGQSPSIQWSKKFGGGSPDLCNKIIQTSDGNFVAIGSSKSANGDVSNHHSSGGPAKSDVWILKIDINGSILWNKSLGGDFDDSGASIEETSDGGFIIAGTTMSNQGDVSGLHGVNGGPFGPTDMWIVKIDSIGNIQWQKCVGSDEDDASIKIKSSGDSSYLLLGGINYWGGDISISYGNSDVWISEMNSIGSIQWQRTYGGFFFDVPYGMTILNDGSILIVAGVESSDGNVTCSNPSKGVWVIKVDSTGHTLWQKCYGGSGGEEGLDIVQSNDGGFFVAAWTGSSDGDVTGLIGLHNYWILKCDSVGNILWEKCLGGTWYDQGRAITTCYDGGLIACGYTESTIVGSHGMKDAYVVKLDSLGNLEWEKCYGGSQDDEANSVIQLPDSSFMIAGTSNSIDGDITNYRGSQDFWVIKLNPPFTGVNEIDRYYSDLSGFIGESSLHVKFNSRSEESILLTVSDLLGRTVFEEKVKAHTGINEFQFPTNLSKSISILQLKAKSGVISAKIF